MKTMKTLIMRIIKANILKLMMNIFVAVMVSLMKKIIIRNRKLILKMSI